MTDYLLQMKNIADMLATAGSLVPDEDLILYVLSQLGPKYDYVAINIIARQDALNFEETQVLLLNQEIRMEQ